MENFSTRWLKNIVKSAIPPTRVRGWWRIKMRLENTEGLEIGGPTPYFVRSGLVPLYPILSRVDHCNISRENFNLQKLRCREEWEVDLLTLDASNTDNLGRKIGRAYV